MGQEGAEVMVVGQEDIPAGACVHATSIATSQILITDPENTSGQINIPTIVPTARVTTRLNTSTNTGSIRLGHLAAVLILSRLRPMTTRFTFPAISSVGMLRKSRKWLLFAAVA